jgi:polyhydroxybutyrate depolymerase
VFLVVILLLAGCTGTRRRVDPPEPDRDVIPIGQSTATITVDGLERTYRMYRPTGLPDPAPLVVVLHGAVGTGQQAEQDYGFDAQADSGKFLVAYPDGFRRTWNVTADCCGGAARDNVDDLGFIRQLVDTVSRRAPVDQKRIYATGISNGALMAYKLACDTTIFAAIGAVAGTMINRCDKPAPLSIIHIHGRDDRTVPYGGGPGRRSNAGAGERNPAKIVGPPVESLMAQWRKWDSCQSPEVTTTGQVTTSTATCPQGRAVELISIAGAGHQWPGGRPTPVAERLLRLDPPSQALQATPTIWQFFAAHPKT